MMRLNLLKYKTKKALKKNEALRVSVPWAQAKTIGIIFTVEDRTKHDLVKDFIRKIEQNNKTVNVLTFLPNKKENFEFLYDFFSVKDLNLWGTIHSDSLNKFIDKPFDFLFYLDATPNPFMMHILARSKARCRVGKLFENCEAYFEFMLGATNNTSSLLDSIHTYISKLK